MALSTNQELFRMVGEYVIVHGDCPVLGYNLTVKLSGQSNILSTFSKVVEFKIAIFIHVRMNLIAKVFE